MVSKLGTRIILKFLLSCYPCYFNAEPNFCSQINLLPEDSLINRLFFSQVGVGLI